MDRILKISPSALTNKEGEMKIAIISSGFLPVVDGVTVTLTNRIHQLSQGGHQVLLFCPDYSCLADVYPNWRDYTGDILPGVKVINLASESVMGLNFERNVTQKSYQTVLRSLQDFQPNIIHVDEPERLFIGFLKVPGVTFAQQNRIPCVSFFHTNFLDYGKDYFNTPAWLDAIIKWFLKFPLAWIYNQYDVTLVASNVTYKKLSQMGVKPIIKNDLLGVDLARFEREFRDEEFFAKKYGISGIDSKIKLIFLNRLTPDKGWQFTINAFSKIAKETNLENIALIIAGDGVMREEIIAQLGNLTPHFAFLGRVDPDDVPALLINSDIHITNSQKETRGLTVLEAFAAGIPVIAPRAGGIIDSIKDGWNGFLYDPQNYDDFADKLKVLTSDRNLRQTMGVRAKEYIAEYSWENAVKNLLKIWRNQSK
jgi:glycosyltransferase involved in cell wall biosynthesis